MTEERSAAPAVELPDSMLCVEISEPGGPEVLKPARRPLPEIGPGQVLIKARSMGVNRPDVLQRQGRYPLPPGVSDLCGLEMSGTIVRVSPGVTEFAVGDQVCALLPGGGYAEYAMAPVETTLPAPRGIDLLSAGAVPETFFTVWHNMIERGRLKAGESVLIHGGGSGIGTTAIQLAKVMGALVITTAGSDERCERCVKLGARLAVNYRERDFVEAVLEATGGRGVDLVLDMVGGDYLPRNIKALAEEGRHVSIAFLRGPRVEMDLDPVMRRRLTLTGSTMRPQSLENKKRIARGLLDHVWPLFADGKVVPLIHAGVPLERAAEAHVLMERGDHFGKIVLLPPGMDDPATA